MGAKWPSSWNEAFEPLVPSLIAFAAQCFHLRLVVARIVYQLKLSRAPGFVKPRL